MREYCSKRVTHLENEYGRKEKSILEPSSGGMGIKLNNASAKFTITIVEVIK